MNDLDYNAFIRERITELRIKKGVSEYKMSRDLGHNNSYIANIMSKKTLPSMSEFLYICEYFNTSPQYFFDTGIEEPSLLSTLNLKMRELTPKEIQAILTIIECILTRK